MKIQCKPKLVPAGTTLRYSPGIVTGGSGYTHDCGRSRSIGFFLEPLVCIALFAKKVAQWYLHSVAAHPVYLVHAAASSNPFCCHALPWSLQPLSITLRGITNAAADPSVDVWRTVTLPLLRQATGLSEGFELKIMKRGAEPLVCTCCCSFVIFTDLPRAILCNMCSGAMTGLH